MPVIDGPVGPDGPLLTVEIGVAVADRNWLRQQGRPVPQSRYLTALIDTGAECSCIEQSLVRPLGLFVYRLMSAVSAPSLFGLSMQSSYTARMAIADSTGEAANELVIPTIVLMELDLRGFPFEALIGRDVLAQCDLVYRGRSDWFSLEWP